MDAGVHEHKPQDALWVREALAMTVRIRVTGQQRIERRLGMLVPEARTKALNRMAGAIRRANPIETPQRTGNLVKSLRIQIVIDRVVATWTASYAKYANRRGRSRGWSDRVIRRAFQFFRSG